MMFFDRVKILVMIAVLLGFVTAKYHAELPIISWGAAVRRPIPLR